LVEEGTSGLLSELSVPGPVVFDQSLVGGVLNIGLSPVIELVVVALGHFLGDLSATEEPGTTDGELGLLSEDQHATETVLSELVEALEPSTNKVVGLEELIELIVILVLGEPDAPAVLLEVLPEPGESSGTGVFVGVLSLPRVEVELGWWELVKGVGGLGSLLLFLFGDLLKRLLFLGCFLLGSLLLGGFLLWLFL